MTVTSVNYRVSPLDTGEHFLNSLTVDLIMTSRQQLMTCRREDSISDVNKHNEEKFSYLPVVDDEERIIGLYNAEQPHGASEQYKQIVDRFMPFSEAFVIGADASIIDFARTADKLPTRLVISGSQVAGLGPVNTI